MESIDANEMEDLIAESVELIEWLKAESEIIADAGGVAILTPSIRVALLEEPGESADLPPGRNGGGHPPGRRERTERVRLDPVVSLARVLGVARRDLE